MKSAIKTFKHPDLSITKQRESKIYSLLGSFLDRTTTIIQDIPISYQEMLDRVHQFIDSIGPDRIINVNQEQYQESWDEYGARTITEWKIFYWENE